MKRHGQSISKQETSDLNPAQRTDPRALGRQVLGGLLATGVATASLFAANAKSSFASPALSQETEPALIGHNNVKNTAFEAKPSEPVVSTATRNRVVYINNKPTFLFGIWEPSDDQTISSLHANLMVDVNDTLAQQVNGRAWVLRQSRPLKAEGLVQEPIEQQIAWPNEIGVSRQDEAEHYSVTAKEYAQTPGDGRLTFANFADELSGIYFGIDADKNFYTPYIESTPPQSSIVGEDIYPKAASAGLALIYEYTLGAKMMAGKDRAVETYIQTVPFTGDNLKYGGVPALSMNYVLGGAKAAIAAGANVINWWDRDGGGPDGRTSPQIATGIRNFTDKIHNEKVSRCLLGKQIDNVVSKPNDPIKMGGRLFLDKNGKENYCMILTNSTDRPITFNRKLPGLKRQVAKDAWNNIPTTVNSGRLKVVIPPKDWVLETYIKN